jgi:hypothetical protein
MSGNNRLGAPAVVLSWSERPLWLLKQTLTKEHIKPRLPPASASLTRFST